MSPWNETVAPASAERSTLYVAVEISRKGWVVGIKNPASERIGLHSLGAADVVGVKTLIENHQAKAEQALGSEARVLCCYEAGYEGFWLARWLDEFMSLETVVLDPASLLVNRKAKQRKTDRIDARKMVRALLAHDRGDAAVLSQVRIPSVEQEDRKRLLRERHRLVKERTSLSNTIKGLLKIEERQQGLVYPLVHPILVHGGRIALSGRRAASLFEMAPSVEPKHSFGGTR
ncbi:MAG: transposase [Rhodospirillales bacterium]|nr:transposase [Rhodospirillales bacterium]